MGAVRHGFCQKALNLASPRQKPYNPQAPFNGPYTKPIVDPYKGPAALNAQALAVDPLARRTWLRW